MTAYDGMNCPIPTCKSAKVLERLDKKQPGLLVYELCCTKCDHIWIEEYSLTSARSASGEHYQLAIVNIQPPAPDAAPIPSKE